VRRGSQNVRHILQGIVGDADQNAGGVAGQLGVGNRMHVLIDERGGRCGSRRIAAGDGGNGLAAILEKPSEGLAQASGSGDSDSFHLDMTQRNLTLAKARLTRPPGLPDNDSFGLQRQI
jgi:hypothetical protein